MARWKEARPLSLETGGGRGQALFAALLALAIFTVDTFTPLSGAVAVLYGIVVMLAGAALHGRRLLVVAMGCAALTLASYLLEHSASLDDSAALRCVVSLAAIGATAYLVARNQAASGVLRSQAELLDLTHDAIFVRSLDDRILFWNRAAEEVYGWSAAEALGARASELLKTRYPDEPDAIREELLRANRWEGELVERSRDGAEFVMASRWSLGRATDGSPEVILETNTDITARKRSDLELRVSEARYRSIFHSAGVAIWSGDYCRVSARLRALRAEGVTDFRSYAEQHPDFVPSILALIGDLDANETAARMWGARDRQELISRFPEVFSCESLPVYLGLLEALVSGAKEFQGAMPLRTLNGEPLSTWMAVTLPQEDRGLSHLLLTFTDLTAQTAAEAALQQAQADLAHASRLTTLGQFTATIAHEVNQPLAAIATNGEAALRFLSRQDPELGEVRNALDRIIHGARSGSEVVARMRAQLKNSRPERAPVALGEVATEAALLLHREMRSRGVELRLEFPPDLPTVLGDRVQLQHVLVNLVMNSAQALANQPAPRRIVVQAEARSAEEVCVAVTDNGPGIPDEDLQRLFAAFFSTKPDGMGLGLAICRSTIESHGGAIRAKPTKCGGACIEFTLPPIRERPS